MTKNDIIESVAYVDCLPGDQLVEHEIGDLGLTVTHLEGDSIAKGLRIQAAGIFADYLARESTDLPEAPAAKLFERLHRSSLEFNQQVIEQTFIEAVGEDSVESHRKVVRRLREIALKLGIQYEEPDDPILKMPEGPLDD